MSQLPKGWVSATLGDVADVIAGQSPDGSTYNDRAEGLPFFQGKAEFGELYPTVRKWTTAERAKVADAGDILLSVRAPVGPTNLAPERCVIGRGLAAIRPCGGVSQRYLLWAVRASVREIQSKATGSTFDAVSADVVRSHQLAIAPLAEQQRIVAAIDEAMSKLEAGLDYLSAARRRLDSLRTAVLRDEFSKFRTVALAQRCVVVAGRTPTGVPNGDLTEATSGATPFVKVGDMNSAPRFIDASRTYFSKALATSSKLQILPEGTLIFPKAGGAIATNKKRQLALPAAVDLNTMAVIPGDGVDPEFLYWFFETVDLRKFIDGSVLPQLGKGTIEQVAFPDATLDEQVALVARLEHMFSLLDNEVQAIEAQELRAERMHRAILHAAFSGQLVPQDPSDEPASVLLERIAAERAASGASKGKGTVKKQAKSKVGM